MNRTENTPLVVASAVPTSPAGRFAAKILSSHRDKLALVYIRQSSPQQVLENRESTARQYAFADYAVTLGWPRERVLVIDDDLGKSGRTAEGRSGFQRLVTEVTLDHVGLVLGLEMSRLARSSRDWHNLFELCALYGSLLADEDGVYDANDANDRLLLGLKGIMSEMELHIMRNRLLRGRDHKAQRGELFHSVPMGYVLLPTGEVDFDPDQQAQDVLRLVFAKFTELGTIYGLLHWFLQHDVRLPVRVRCGVKKGQLDWRRPSLQTLAQILHHPMYAGAYVYGRRLVDAKTKLSAGRPYRPWAPPEQWKVLLHDRLPAYISWEQYLKNREQIQRNRSGPAGPGVPRQGVALLTGLVVCGNCGRHMQPTYYAPGKAQYHCKRQYVEGTEPHCYSLAAKPLDELVAQQVLAALEPAALALSLQARTEVEQERQRLDQHWQQRCQRARYEVELAERRYQAVDPGHRLVAGTLEKRWEEALQQQRQLQEEYDRFAQQTPLCLSQEQAARITALAADIPALWTAAPTTNADRKEIIRCLVEQVSVQVRCDSEWVGVTIAWAGGYVSQHDLVRPVASYAQLREFERLLGRVAALRGAGHSAAKIAATLNAEGFYPPKRSGKFTAAVVYALLKRRSLIGNERSHGELLAQHEWWLTDLAHELKITHMKLRDWVNRGWVHSRKTPVQGRWILWANKAEVKRLKKLLAESRRGMNTHNSDLTTPKKRVAAAR
jgi:DNA invertase Pin-like site-specific DNA recombinase